MTRFPCSGCGRMSCHGECYAEDCSTDCGLAQLIAEHPELRDYQLALRARLNAGLGLVEVEHLGPGRIAA